MELERLAVAVRPRGGWEALDLGFSMARHWWRPLWLAWLSLYVPTGLLLHFIFRENMWMAMLLLWWLQPLFDRIILHVVAHAVFDSAPSLRQTFAAAKDWLRPGCIAGITFYRFQFARSLMLPVWQLEKQRGRAARDRRALLGRRLGGYGIWLSFLSLIFAYVLFRAFELLPALLDPVDVDTDFELADYFASSLRSWGWQKSLCAATALSIVGPFYVCAGFALYLNRRAALEGWDIEISLRKLAQRLGKAAVTMCAFALIGISASAPAPAYAQAAPQSADTPAEVVKEVLAHPDFGEERTVKRLVPRLDDLEEDKDESEWNFDFLSGLGRVIARIAQVLGWLIVAGIVILLVRAALRYAGWGGAQRVEKYEPPAALFGLDLRPQSLPEDVAAAAAALARAGQLREALSLLYRGALSALVHFKKVELAEGDTEHDCLAAAQPVLRNDGRLYFGELVDAWCKTAYARRLPQPDQIEKLCGEWDRHFRAQAGEGAPA